MTIEHISDGANSHRNDDHITVFSRVGVTDILVLDGATSVAEQDYIDPVRGDAAWFVHAFTAALEQVLAPGRSQKDCVQAAVAMVRSSFESMGETHPAPLHAWPIAALTWLRVSQRDGESQASLYSLGDCKSLLFTPGEGCIDLDPFINPQEGVVQDEIARLRADGVTTAEERRARMLPMLRARREFQNIAPAPEILCLRPRGAFKARSRRFALPPDARVLIMSDGFYRLVDPYGLYTDALLVDACVERGLAAMLNELRMHEATAGGTSTQVVKAADDASAVIRGADAPYFTVTMVPTRNAPSAASHAWRLSILSAFAGRTAKRTSAFNCAAPSGSAT